MLVVGVWGWYLTASGAACFTSPCENMETGMELVRRCMIYQNVKDSFARVHDSITESEILMHAMPAARNALYIHMQRPQPHIYHTPPHVYLTNLPFCICESQSHLPPSQPSLHLSFHNPQSNSPFPSFRLTSLCALHIHSPNSSRPRTRGSFSGLLIQS